MGTDRSHARRRARFLSACQYLPQTDQQFPCIQQDHQGGQENLHCDPIRQLQNHHKALQQQKNHIDCQAEFAITHPYKAPCVHRAQQEDHEIADKGGECRAVYAKARDQQKI